jgi:hypothetical protein
MKTESYNNPRPARSTSSLLVSLAVSSAILAAILALTGCGIPVAIAVQGEGASVGYSSKGGITVTVQK